MIEWLKEKVKSYSSARNHSQLQNNCKKLTEIWLFLINLFYWPNWALNSNNFGREPFQISSNPYCLTVITPSGGNYGGLGGNCPPIQQDSEIFSVEVGNFEGGIENAMKKRVAVEKEKQRVSILNEQTKCSRSICNICLSFYALFIT